MRHPSVMDRLIGNFRFYICERHSPFVRSYGILRRTQKTVPVKTFYYATFTHALECPPEPMIEKFIKAFCTTALHMLKMLAHPSFLALDQTFTAAQGMVFPAVFF